MYLFENLPAIPKGVTHFFREGHLVVNGRNKRVVLSEKEGDRGDYGECICCHTWDNDWAILCESCYEDHLQRCKYHKEQP